MGNPTPDRKTHTMTDDMNPGSLVAAGGWSIPKDQMPGWPFDRLLVPIRGGMKYPTPTKETHAMAEQSPEEELLHLLDLRAQLDKRIIDVQQRRIPAAPAMSAGNMFQVSVKFTPGGMNYKFLLYRAPNAKGWYTTGKGEAGHFESWRELVEWLRGPDVYWHSNVEKLIATSDVVILPSERRNA